MSGEKDGMAVMEKQDQITINPHKKVAFDPGGLHVMLIRPKNPLKAGDEVTLIMTTADDSKLTVSAKVVKKTSVSKNDSMHNKNSDSSHHHDHSH